MYWWHFNSPHLALFSFKATSSHLWALISIKLFIRILMYIARNLLSIIHFFSSSLHASCLFPLASQRNKIFKIFQRLKGRIFVTFDQNIQLRLIKLRKWVFKSLFAKIFFQNMSQLLSAHSLCADRIYCRNIQMPLRRTTEESFLLSCQTSAYTYLHKIPLAHI